jgi:transposase InsO family protein
VEGNDASFKYENIYLHRYKTAVELECGLASYFDFYCYERLHMALGYRTPWEAYSEGRRIRRAK